MESAMITARRAFSLLELLVVIAIIGVLAALIVPSITTLLQSNTLTRSGQMVADQINLARQLASTRSATMEVRLIRLPNRPADGFHALQIWGATGAGTNAPAGRFLRLPDGAFIAEDTAKFSPMLGLLTNGGTMTGGPANGAPYVAFRIRPAGTVVPAFSATNRRADLCLSVVPERTSSATNNYLTVQINPDTGNTAVYRPE